RRGERHGAVALAHRPGDERAADLHARRASVSAGGGGRYALRVHVVLTRDLPPEGGSHEGERRQKPRRGEKAEATKGREGRSHERERRQKPRDRVSITLVRGLG